jgi:lysophospholipase L1-like esterase
LKPTVAQVLAGTAPVVGANSPEPALPALGANGGVGIADIDTAFGKSAEYFGVDGLHPNERGIALIAQTVLAVIAKTNAMPSYIAR